MSTPPLFQKNSNDERQQRWFARVSELLVGEPAWNDGEVIEAWHRGGV